MKRLALSLTLIVACGGAGAVSSTTSPTEGVASTTEATTTSTTPPSTTTTSEPEQAIYPGEELWRFDAGGSVATPVVSEGIVYFGSSDGRAYAVDAATGLELWTFAALGSTSTPFANESPTQGSTNVAVADGVVYVVGPDGNAYALDAGSGSELWRLETEEGFVRSPSVSNSVVYIGGGDGQMYALNAATGSEVWRFQLEEELGFGTKGLLTASSPVISDGSIYFLGDNHHVFALNAATGNQIWRIETPEPIQTAPAVSGSAVFVGSSGVNDGHAVALEAGSGSVLWSFQVDNWVVSTPAVDRGVVYFGIYAGMDNGLVYAIDVSTGLLWEFMTGGGVTTSPAVHDGTVYVGSADTYLYAIDSLTGDERWRFATGAGVSSSPAISNGVVYVGSDDGNLYAIRAEGSRVEEPPATPTEATTPSVSTNPPPELGALAVDYFISSEAICTEYASQTGNPAPDPARFLGVVAQSTLDESRVLIRDGLGYELIVDFGASPATIYSSMGPDDVLPFDLSYGCPSDLFLGSAA